MSFLSTRRLGALAVLALVGCQGESPTEAGRPEIDGPLLVIQPGCSTASCLTEEELAKVRVSGTTIAAAANVTATTRAHGFGAYSFKNVISGSVTKGSSARRIGSNTTGGTGSSYTSRVPVNLNCGPAPNFSGKVYASTDHSGRFKGELNFGVYTKPFDVTRTANSNDWYNCKTDHSQYEQEEAGHPYGEICENSPSNPDGTPIPVYGYESCWGEEQPPPGGGGGQEGHKYCVVDVTYWIDTGEIVHMNVLYCYRV